MKLSIYSSLLLTICILLWSSAKGQVGIGTTSPHSSSVLEIQSTSKGFLPPRLSRAERDLIVNPAEGLLLFNTSDSCINFYNGTMWINPCLQNTGQTLSSVIADANFPAAGGTPSLNDLQVVGLTNVSALQTEYEEAIATANPQPTTLEELQTIINNVNTLEQFTFPNTLTLQQTDILKILSIYDTDYAPFSLPIQPANLNTSVTPITNNGQEVLVDIQGTITTTGKEINIPCVSTGSGTLPSFSLEISVPAQYSQDGIAGKLILSWLETNFSASTTSISATIKSVDATLNIKKLDVQTGIGNDYLGIGVVQVDYPYNSSGDTYTFKVNAIAGIPDRMYGIEDSTGSTTSHQFIYLPILAEDGEVWLNNNLGANYTNQNHLAFNPIQQAIQPNDYMPMGACFNGVVFLMDMS